MQKEECPYCKKRLKYVKRHINRYHSYEENKAKGLDVLKKNPDFLKEINLQGEFTKMTDTINPKKEKEESKDPKFKCGACGGTFNERHKRCPHCGVEFE